MPVIWLQTQVATHFFHLRWDLNGHVRLNVQVRPLGALRVADVLRHHQVLLGLDLLLQTSVALGPLVVILLLVIQVLSRLGFLLDLLLA